MFKEIKLDFVDKMGSDLFVANVARVSFDNWKEEYDDKDASLIRYLAEHKHTTPFRHPHLSIRCQAPIFLARQLGKHQVGMDWNEVSRRYVRDEFSFFTPEIWRKKPEGSIKQGSSDEQAKFVDKNGYQIDINKYYVDWVRKSIEVYNMYIEAGVCPEQARMLLPQSMNVKWIWTGSLLAFAHVYNLRSDFTHAQKDLLPFVQQLDEICMKNFPVAWSQLTRVK